MSSGTGIISKSDIRTFSNLEKASLAAADLIGAAAGAAISDKGFFTLVLTGGTSVRLLYEYLGGPPYSSRLSWQQIHFFWGDERCVGPDHPDSNYAMARELLLAKVIAPQKNVHRIPAEQTPPEKAAREYEKELRAFFAPHPELSNGLFPRFDLVLLGMGTDGHTASLFPGLPQLQEEERWVTAIPESAGRPPLPRITLTLPVLNSAREVMFLTAGFEKKAILDQIAADPQSAAMRFPAARVRPAGELRWFHAEEAG